MRSDDWLYKPVCAILNSSDKNHSSQLSASSTKMFAVASLIALATAALPTVFAHGGVLLYSNEGNYYQGWCVNLN